MENIYLDIAVKVRQYCTEKSVRGIAADSGKICQLAKITVNTAPAICTSPALSSINNAGLVQIASAKCMRD